MGNAILEVGRRNLGRERRADRAGDEPLREIVARELPRACVALAGVAAVALPAWAGVAGEPMWTAVVAYGGCLVGYALGGGAVR